jgi:hypothetical protein
MLGVGGMRDLCAVAMFDPHPTISILFSSHLPAVHPMQGIYPALHRDQDRDFRIHQESTKT